MPTHVRRPGLKRHRVDIQAYVETKNDEGGTIRTFSTVDGLWWAEIVPVRGRGQNDEDTQADQQKAVKSHTIYMRFFDPGVDESMRVVFGTTIFNIVTVVNPGERGCDTILEVQEVQNPL